MRNSNFMKHGLRTAFHEAVQRRVRWKYRNPRRRATRTIVSNQQSHLESAGKAVKHSVDETNKWTPWKRRKWRVANTARNSRPHTNWILRNQNGQHYWGRVGSPSMCHFWTFNWHQIDGADKFFSLEATGEEALSSQIGSAKRS
jgi:hypothetical protein